MSSLELTPVDNKDEQPPATLVGSTTKVVNRTPVGFSLFNMQTNRRILQELTLGREKDFAYIAELEKIIREAGLELPEHITSTPRTRTNAARSLGDRIMQDGSLMALEKSIASLGGHNKMHEVCVQYRDLTFWNMVPPRTIPTVGSAVKKLFFGSGPKNRVNIIKGLTGRILPKRMTLLMGPPGCGKSVCVSCVC
jgi:hypothetical protein